MNGFGKCNGSPWALISRDIQVYVFCLFSRFTKLYSQLVFIKTLSFAYYLTGFQFDYVFDWTILKYQQSQIGGAPSRTMVYSTIHAIPCSTPSNNCPVCVSWIVSWEGCKFC